MPRAPVMSSTTRLMVPVADYDLAHTLACGQAFRWRESGDAWEGVIGARWVRLRLEDQKLHAETAVPAGDWMWLRDYLQVDCDMPGIIATFPDDVPLGNAVSACRGLRLLKQDPWECLASFILSSTKQIVQIRQIVELLCERFGEPVAVPPGHSAVFAFPTPARLAACSESELRACKMGFRAPNLLGAARAVAEGRLPLDQLGAKSCEEARAELMALRGVGRKIADCVLLFAYGFQAAFPVDVWVLKALRQLYFPKRRPSPERLMRFTAEYFGHNSGYAQQYLFHYMRTVHPRVPRVKLKRRAAKRNEKH